MHERKRRSPGDEPDDADENLESRRWQPDSDDTAALEDWPLAYPLNKYDNILFSPDIPEQGYYVYSVCSFINFSYLK